MDSTHKTRISVETEIKAPVETVWKFWTTPDDIVMWNNASEDWCTTSATNDLKVGGKFNYRMEAKDRSMGFDYEGTYQKVVINHQIEYITADARNVNIVFTAEDNRTKISEVFEAENFHSIDQQRDGWQAILDNFKKYVEIKF